MLPKNERLRKNKDFERVFKYKCSVSTLSVVAYIEPKDPASNDCLPCAGFIIGKKIHKKANKRNKVKRRMREAYRKLREENPELIKDFNAIIFIARLPILELDYFQIYENIFKCLKKAKKTLNKKAC